MVSASNSNLALVFGVNRLGALGELARLLHRYGYPQVVAVTNHAALLPDANMFSAVIEHADYSDFAGLATKITNIAGFRPDETPFLCIADRAMFAYLRVRRALGCVPTRDRRWVPEEGILRARIKPAARSLWRRFHVDATRHIVVRRNELPSALVQSALMAPSNTYVVKPIAGSGSEQVKVVSASSLDDAVESVRATLKDSNGPDIEVDGVHYHPDDVLVEEELCGSEYTVDGYVNGDDLAFVVQHKETRYSGTFIGDGLISSPPDYSWPHIGALSSNTLQRSEQCTTPVSEFASLLSRGLRALGLDQWAFHAEVMETDHGLRFVELNPRPAGGLLWHTAGLHLGLDPREALVRMHLGIPTKIPRPGWVTGQFPIYAEKTGVIEGILGADDARRIPGVVRVDVVAKAGDVIESVERENYLIFVALHAPTHSEIREAEWRVRCAIRVDYA